jgi:hypothetical protein
MRTDRETEEFEEDRKKWKIVFDVEQPHLIEKRSNSNVIVHFIINMEERNYLTKEDIQNLKQDLKDLGKFRIIKEGKDFLKK